MELDVSYLKLKSSEFYASKPFRTSLYVIPAYSISMPKDLERASLEALEFSKYWYEFSTWTRTVTSLLH